MITSLEDSDGNSITDHNAKAELIWVAFNDRLGVSSFQGMNFNLPTLIHVGHDLSSLVAPFSNEEVDSMIRHLPSDKALGLDGFNTDFLKKCWPIFC